MVTQKANSKSKLGGSLLFESPLVGFKGAGVASLRFTAAAGEK